MSKVAWLYPSKILRWSCGFCQCFDFLSVLSVWYFVSCPAFVSGTKFDLIGWNHGAYRSRRSWVRAGWSRGLHAQTPCSLHPACPLWSRHGWAGLSSGQTTKQRPHSRGKTSQLFFGHEYVRSWLRNFISAKLKQIVQQWIVPTTYRRTHI